MVRRMGNLSASFSSGLGRSPLAAAPLAPGMEHSDGRCHVPLPAVTLVITANSAAAIDEQDYECHDHENEKENDPQLAIHPGAGRWSLLCRSSGTYHLIHTHICETSRTRGALNETSLCNTLHNFFKNKILYHCHAHSRGNKTTMADRHSS